MINQIKDTMPVPIRRTGQFRQFGLFLQLIPWFFLFLPGNARSGPDDFLWPIMIGQFPEARGLTSTFGESRSDHFHNGLDIAANGIAVRAMGEGSIIYSRSEEDDPYMPSPGPGDYVFQDHGNGWWSGYYHLTHPSRGDGVKEIGRAGNTGHSSGFHLHFFLLKDNGLTIVNPLEHLPRVKDENPPVIGQISIITPNGTTLVSHSRPQRIRLTRKYPILINIIDPGLEKSTRRGIYRLKWSLNSESERSFLFSNIQFKDNEWKLEGLHPFSEVYMNGLYNLGELAFTEGKNTLTVTAEDLNGNSSRVEFDITVDTLTKPH